VSAAEYHYECLLQNIT